MVTTQFPAEFAAWPSDRAEWLAARRSSIGASEAAAAAGLSRWATPLDVYARKVGLVAETEDNANMWWGREVEPLIVKRFSILTELEVSQYPCPMLRHAKYPFISATPDAELINGELLECKKKNWRMARELGEEGTDDLSNEIICQAQQQMAVCGADRVHVATKVDDSDLLLHVVERNEALIAGLIEAEAELWDRIQRKDPPPPDFNHRATTGLLKEMHGTVREGREVTLCADLVDLWRERQILAARMKADKEREDVIKNHIRSAMQDAEIGICPGEGFYIERKMIVKKSYTVAASESVRIQEKKAK